MRLKTMFLVSLAIVALALATTMTSRAEKPLVISGAAAAEPHDDADHAGESADAHGTDEHADESADAHSDNGHADERADAHGDDDHAGESADAHGDDDHAGESADAHGDDDHSDEGGSDIVKLTGEVAQEAGIVLEQAELDALGESLSLPAEVRFDADRMANVSPRVSGVIDRIFAGEGDTVEYGDRLALISSRDLATLKAQWVTAETRKSLAAQALERAEGLWSKKITSEATVQAARAEHEAAKAESEAAETELHAVGIDHAALEKIATAEDGNNANAYLTAPLSGTVIRRAVTLGGTVTAGDSSAEALFTIVDDSVLWVDIAVYKQDISRVRIGAPVALKSDDGDIITQSTVAFVLPVIDEVSRTATARVIVDNRDKALTPGQFVIADLSVGNAREVLRVPQSAVQLVEGRSSVFVPVDGGFAPRPVMIGTTAGGYVEIRTGLEEGDLFVSDGAFTLKAQLEKDAFGDGHGH